MKHWLSWNEPEDGGGGVRPWDVPLAEGQRLSAAGPPVLGGAWLGPLPVFVLWLGRPCGIERTPVAPRQLSRRIERTPPVLHGSTHETRALNFSSYKRDMMVNIELTK